MENLKLKELFVKVYNVCKEDIYIINSKYIIPGPESYSRMYGNGILILEDKWISELSEYFKLSQIDSTDSIVYIKNIVYAKKYFDKHEENEFVDSPIEIIEPTNIIWKTVTETTSKLLGDADKINNWTSIESDEEFSKSIFDKKGIYSYVLNKKTNDAIHIGKPVLPLITAKTLNKLFFHTEFLDELDLYSFDIKYLFTHFKMYLFYDVVPMKK